MYIYQLNEKVLLDLNKKLLLKKSLKFFLTSLIVVSVVSSVFLIYFLSWSDLYDSLFHRLVVSAFLIIYFLVFLKYILIDYDSNDLYPVESNFYFFSKRWYYEEYLIADVRKDINKEEKKMGSLASEFFNKLLQETNEEEARRILNIGDIEFNEVERESTKFNVKSFNISIIVLTIISGLTLFYLLLCFLYKVNVSSLFVFLSNPEFITERTIYYVLAVVYTLFVIFDLNFLEAYNKAVENVNYLKLDNFLHYSCVVINKYYEDWQAKDYKKAYMPINKELVPVRKLIIKYAIENNKINTKVIDDLRESCKVHDEAVEA